MLVVTRCVSMEHYDCFEILMSIRSRAVKVRGGKGVIAVLQREAKALGCLQNRLYSGIQGISKEKRETFNADIHKLEEQLAILEQQKQEEQARHEKVMSSIPVR